METLSTFIEMEFPDRGLLDGAQGGVTVEEGGVVELRDALLAQIEDTLRPSWADPVLEVG